MSVLRRREAVGTWSTSSVRTAARHLAVYAMSYVMTLTDKPKTTTTTTMSTAATATSDVTPTSAVAVWDRLGSMKVIWRLKVNTGMRLTPVSHADIATGLTYQQLLISLSTWCAYSLDLFTFLYYSSLFVMPPSLNKHSTLCSEKKHPLTVSFISQWIMCRFKQKLQWTYLRNGRC